MQKNAIEVPSLLLKQLGVKFSQTGLVGKLEGHPDFPSLISVSDCLTEWQIANQALNADKTAYTELSCPCIAQFKGDNFVLVNSVNQKEISYSNEKKQNALMPAQEFVKKWTGMVLLAEANEESKEPEYAINIWKDRLLAIRIPLIIGILLTSIALSVNFTYATLSYYLLLSISVLGTGITTLLLINTIDANNPFVQNLCNLGNKNGCNAILKTDAAKVTSWLSWSEVGFFYFTGCSLSLLIVPSSLYLVAWLYLFSLPYTFYSIGYQYKHKNWCMLCCVVQALLLLANLTALNFGLWFSGFTSLQASVFFLTSFSFVLPIIFWLLLKPIFAQSIQFKFLKQQLKKFKYNSDLFHQVLVNQPRYWVGEELMPLTLGNPAAASVITLVSNPFCEPCAKAHQTIDGWLQYRDDLQLKIIFATENHEDDEKTKVSRHISALTLLNDKQVLEKALNDWYAQDVKKYEVWAKKYPVNFSEEPDMATQRQKQWCDMAEIAYTPTILVNGYKLPEPYKLEDIKYLLS